MNLKKLETIKDPQFSSQIVDGDGEFVDLRLGPGHNPVNVPLLRL